MIPRPTPSDSPARSTSQPGAHAATDDLLRFWEASFRPPVTDAGSDAGDGGGVELSELLGWVRTTEAKDPHTVGHGERVARYASRLAAAIGFEGSDLAWFAIGALLHDVGKTAVPAALLTKPGALTPEEWALLREHTVHGDRIVKAFDLPWEVRPIVRSHHERWDGSGYPDRLRGVEIPLTARILCIADLFDSLTSSRSYRAALPPEAALRLMESETGTRLDPGLFHLFRAFRCHVPGGPAAAGPAGLPM